MTKGVYVFKIKLNYFILCYLKIECLPFEAEATLFFGELKLKTHVERLRELLIGCDHAKKRKHDCTKIFIPPFLCQNTVIRGKSIKQVMQ